MLWLWRAICNRCNARFDAGWGHTQRAFCLRCAHCGRPRAVPKGEVEEPPGSNLNLSQATPAASASRGRSIEELLDELLTRGPSPEQVAWEKRVEAALPACDCGGRF